MCLCERAAERPSLIYEIGKALNSNQHRNAAAGDQNMIGGQLEMQISVQPG
jgi:hypothetical protein